jgi:isopropylmalate/homocitrate/citramalate synthase
MKYKLKKTQQQVLDEAVAAVELARRRVDDVEFSAEDGTRTDPEYLEKVSRAVGGGRADGEHRGHGRVRDAEGVRRANWPDREGAG